MAAGFSYYLSLLTIFFIDCSGTTLSCNGNNGYMWAIGSERGCCPRCPPGTYLSSRCTNFNDPAKCKVCPDKTFAQVWNNYRSCAPCKTCLKENGLEYKKKCDHKSNAECKFCTGYSLVNNSKKCIKLCDKGEQKLGDSNSCEPCRPGFYSDKQGNEPCISWTDCAAKGQHVRKNGSRTENAECVSISPIKTTTTEGRTVTTSVTMPTSITTAGKSAFTVENKFLISVIIVAAVLLVIVLIKKKIIRFGGEKRGLCIRIRQDTKPPVQEEFKDITSIQVKN